MSRIKVNTKKLDDLIKSLKKEELKIASRIGTIAVEEIRKEVPVDTGNLRDSTTFEINANGNKYEILSGAESARVLDGKGGTYDRYVYYPSLTRNYSGNKWVDRATPEIEKKVINVINDRINNIIRRYK